MKLPIDASNVHLFAYTNEKYLPDSPRALVLAFRGLGFAAMPTEHSDLSLTCAHRGILYVLPYYNPWSWMNDTAVKTVDAIVDALVEKHSAGDVPLISTGGSMGGLSALIYARYSAHRVAACAAKYPVCDLPYHFTERPDLPRTIVSALAHYDMPFEQAMETISPLHQAEHIPDIPYLILHGDKDLAVNQQKHSERFVAAMKANGRNIRYVSVPGAGHGNLPEQYERIFEEFVFTACEKK